MVTTRGHTRPVVTRASRARGLRPDGRVLPEPGPKARLGAPQTTGQLRDPGFPSGHCVYFPQRARPRGGRRAGPGPGQSPLPGSTWARGGAGRGGAPRPARRPAAVTKQRGTAHPRRPPANPARLLPGRTSPGDTSPSATPRLGPGTERAPAPPEPANQRAGHAQPAGSLARSLARSRAGPSRVRRPPPHHHTPHRRRAARAHPQRRPAGVVVSDSSPPMRRRGTLDYDSQEASCRPARSPRTRRARRPALSGKDCQWRRGWWERGTWLHLGPARLPEWGRGAGTQG
ncbi:protein transport protein sec31-like [Cervus canadensis]|uniref:protein transport protein sec31-like n=1 Tax=Cervus canadensis TaxID=1574408 RepID=UPI001CA3423B|nr:protein transport protein sec31-like [Cervus canadensis]